jgi:heme oxygenase
MSLKDLTWDHHKNAERQAFVKELMSGKIAEERYCKFLYNLYLQYDILETVAISKRVIEKLPVKDFKRSDKIREDYEELWLKSEPPEVLPVTTEYKKHILSIQNDKDALMAHIYVRHMGDLSGGQMIAKKVPGQGRQFDFTNEAGLTNEELKDIVRSLIDDDMADEAKICFDFATKTFQQMNGENL